MKQSEYYFYPQKPYASAMYSCVICLGIDANCCNSLDMLACVNYWIRVKINLEIPKRNDRESKGKYKSSKK